DALVGAGDGYGLLARDAVQVGAEEDQRRPQPLPRAERAVAHGPVELARLLGLGRERAPEGVLDPRGRVPEVALDRVQKRNSPLSRLFATFAAGGVASAG